MLIWRGAIGRGALEIDDKSFVRGGRAMWLLAGGVNTAASSKFALAQQQVQLAECLQRRSR